MRDIFLPKLKKIRIENFSLYKNKPTFEYNFINGVNLIVGGNGVGKTTFVNLIRYALVGMYKKSLDVRVYKNKRIDKRTQYSNEYFRNRMSGEYNKNQEARVILEFYIKDILFIVQRNLYDLLLESVQVIDRDNKYFLKGKTLNQKNYEKLDDNSKMECLQFEYEQKVSKEVGLRNFEDFILFINEILIFGENRKTILWDIEFQERILSKYLNSIKLDNQYEEAKQNAKYNDSLARHRSEAIKEIKKVVSAIEQKNKNIQSVAVINKEIDNIRNKITKVENKISAIQKDRIETDNKLKIKISNRIILNNEIEDIENRIRTKEAQVYDDIWEHMNPNYQIFVKNIELNSSCPMCNKALTEEKLKYFIENKDKCILCNSEIKNEIYEISDLTEIRDDLKLKLITKQNIEKEIYNFEEELQKLDNDFRNQSINVVTLRTKLRELEYSIQEKSKETTNEDLSYSIMLNEIAKLEVEKDGYLDESKRFTQEIKEITEKMEEYRVKINNELSDMFSEFAENFLKVKCKLTYDDLDGQGKRYIPIINNKERVDAEELSESQCFFVDHSFRMSLLNFFYRQQSFFICETPESSLDISYEENAADIFLKYLRKPNSLIITSNLNNSEFLEYIVDNVDNIGFINLLNYGNSSTIQKTSEKLIQISKNIEEKVYGKNKNS